LADTKRKEAEIQQPGREKGKKYKNFKYGTWNARALGGPDAEPDPAIKMACLFAQIEYKGWRAALLTDTTFIEQGSQKYRTDKKILDDDNT
jgi:hypothetical protein